MEPFSQHPTYFAASLEEAINTVHSERQPLIENFLYEKSALLIYADDGVGKSILCLQACLQATVKDSKVFGEFDVPHARKVLYFQMERHPDESFERIRHLKNVIPYDSKKFALSVALQGTDLQDSHSRLKALDIVKATMKEINFIPEIIAFDPIYVMASDDLSTAPACNAITSFFRVIQIGTNASILATSHTNRGIRSEEPPYKRVGKDMYGSRFLSAFFTGSYLIEQKSDSSGSVFTLDKNSQKNLEKKFSLNYDASCYCSWIDTDGKYTKKDKLDNFLKTCKNFDKEFSFKEMQDVSGLSDSVLRGHLSGYLEGHVKNSSKLSYGKLLYRFLG